MKYGLLIRAGFWFSARSLGDWPLLMCCLTLPIFPLAALMTEKWAQRKLIRDHVSILLHIIITTTVLIYPVVVILKCESAVLSGFVLMFIASITWLKLVSFAHTNYDIRVLSQSIEKGATHGSSIDEENIKGPTINSVVYFMLAPTLCYQPSYPRTAFTRKGWVTRQLIKCVVFTGLMGFIIEQYINPIVQNSKHPLKGNFLDAIERVLKLSVPTLYVWLCMFYSFFHLWLNILAELLRFGDREFYKDWWNAKTVEEYWRMWNMPVHKWIVRHIYFPCIRNGLSKGCAILIAFLVSAVFHELCIAVPCHIFKLWAFSGIMFQIPLLFLTKYLQEKFKNTMVGNMIFWFFFSIVGQPMCVLLYYHDVMNRQAQTNG
ncbi:diacylglycerol O-acyltransferase 1-2 isoform X2 [Triticum urartu]|nr:diacylglycerol O-acyltransferase 1-2-like isoform X2 [Triticum dicoccoides]XP_044423303.1 diacylglycerol O-acyltransferase 1-2-like isoform X2 [Triticum aestivum]XP_048541160.1 diacylglycerol O-acyltransferase 1-2 isoform X2 [Triticum urartu]